MHDDGSMTGTYMVRRGDWKLVHYVGCPPELFHLAADPFEERNLAGRPETAGIQRHLYDELHRVVDPDAADRRAFADQEARIERLGGVEAILARPDFNFTPLPADLSAPPSAARTRGAPVTVRSRGVSGRGSGRPRRARPSPSTRRGP